MRRVGILLAGCGRYDGSDVTETALLRSALEEAGHRVVFVAPDVEQAGVVDHATGNLDENASGRNVLQESARLAGESVRDAAELLPGELDALVIPGGAGVVRNLCRDDGGPLGGGEPILPVRDLLDSLRERNAPVAGLGLARVLLLRHLGRSLAEEPGIPGPGDRSRYDDGRVLYATGTMSGGDLSEWTRGVRRLVEEITARLEGGGEERS